MDRALYIAGNGARELMHRQDVQSNNLANASTPGFRAEIGVQRSAPVTGGPGNRTRAFAVETTPGTDMTAGPMQASGRDLDAAVQGNGWFTVGLADGTEAYTRSGSLDVTPDGVLVDTQGRPMLDNTGQPINVPQDAKIVINENGSVSTVSNLDPRDSQQIAQLKLVNPPATDLVRGGDGLFRLRQGGVAQADLNVRVASGMLEGSNVSAVDTMVNMIAAARHFDVQTQLIKNADDNEKSATSILTLS